MLEDLDIFADGEPGITIRHDSCRVARCSIFHRYSAGIACEPGASRASLQDLRVINVGAPATGAERSPAFNNITASGVDHLRMERISVVRGSSGVYLVNCLTPFVSDLHGADIRGPMPRGQLLQLNKSPGAVVRRFSCINLDSRSFPEDIVSVFASDDCELRDGVVWGNNSTSGDGIMFEDCNGGLCHSVDAVYQSNGSFSAAGGSQNIRFEDCRSYANRNSDLGRGRPSSGGLIFGTFGKGTQGTSFARCIYTKAARPDNVVYNVKQASLIDIREAEFTPRRPALMGLADEADLDRFRFDGVGDRAERSLEVG